MARYNGGAMSTSVSIAQNSGPPLDRRNPRQGDRSDSRPGAHLCPGRPPKWAALRVQSIGASIRRGGAQQGGTKPVADLRHSRGQLAGQAGASLARSAGDLRPARRPDEPGRRRPARAGFSPEHQRRHHDAQPARVPRGAGGGRATRRGGGERVVAIDRGGARLSGPSLRGQGHRLRGRPLARRRASEKEPPGNLGARLLRRRRRFARLQPIRRRLSRQQRDAVPRRRQGGRRSVGGHLHVGHHRQAEGRRAQVPEGRDARRHAVHRRDADALGRRAPRHVPALPLDRLRVPGVHRAPRRHVGADGRVQARAVSAARRSLRRDHDGGRSDDAAPRAGARAERAREIRRPHGARRSSRRRAAPRAARQRAHGPLRRRSLQLLRRDRDRPRHDGRSRTTFARPPAASARRCRATRSACSTIAGSRFRRAKSASSTRATRCSWRATTTTRRRRGPA